MKAEIRGRDKLKSKTPNYKTPVVEKIMASNVNSEKRSSEKRRNHPRRKFKNPTSLNFGRLVKVLSTRCSPVSKGNRGEETIDILIVVKKT